jgi:hypothetical protein
MSEPPMKAIWFSPRAMPRSEAGKASVRMAALLAKRNPPPITWIVRKITTSRAPAFPRLGVKNRRIEARVNTAKPRLYRRTRPKMSDRRPKETSSVAVMTE